MIETICFNPLRIPDAIKFTPIAVTVVKFPPFRVHQQVKYPGFLPQVGGGRSKLILLFTTIDIYKELKKRKYFNGAKGF